MTRAGTGTSPGRLITKPSWSGCALDPRHYENFSGYGEIEFMKHASRTFPSG
jgi:hypothetical protein